MPRVIEVGGYAAGYAGRLFVRAGCDVIRVESKPKPAWASQAAMDAFLHAGKQRVEISLDALSGDADTVIYDAGSAKILEDDRFDELSPSIKVAITPFGRTGPKANWRATPSTILAMGGYTNIMGDEGRAPLTLPGHYLEFQTGAIAYTAAASLLHSKRSGLVDVGMLETLMSLSQFTTVLWHCAGEIRGRHGSDLWSVAPSDLFRCADGWVYINIVPAFWDPFVALVGSPDLLIDSRFENNDTRMANRDVLRDLIADAFLELSRTEIDERAATFRVPLGVVRTMDDVLVEEHLHQRGFWETLRMSDGGEVRSPGLPFNYNRRQRPSFELVGIE